MQQMPLTLDQVFTVSEINSEVKWILDTQFGSIWVEGELSNTMRARTGHMYFSIKDSRSQLRCAMFRNDNRRIDFTPADGQKVLCRGRLGIYEARGDYQMIVDRMLETGAGALQQQFEKTKQRLHAEGLFDEAHKKTLPPYPSSIGFITSPTGAAIQDALNILKRRYPLAQVIVYPATVQGKTAAPSIVRMLQLANKRAECDVLLLIRGGGSLEDLWAFNEEPVARAVFASKLPVITGVGHEIDFTIADLVADLRAPTPSAAAELSSPDQRELAKRVQAIQQRAHRYFQQLQAESETVLQQLQRRLSNHHPSNRLRQRAQRCDELEMRLQRLINNQRNRSEERLKQLKARLGNLSPQLELKRRQTNLRGLKSRLANAIESSLSNAELKLRSDTRALQAISPHNTLARGYAIVRKKSGSVVTASDQVASGESLDVHLAGGTIGVDVTELSGHSKLKT